MISIIKIFYSFVSSVANHYLLKFQKICKVQMYSSKTDDKCKQELANVENNWINYQMIIYIPKNTFINNMLFWRVIHVALEHCSKCLVALDNLNHMMFPLIIPLIMLIKMLNSLLSQKCFSTPNLLSQPLILRTLFI